jgi:hypothetical protein
MTTASSGVLKPRPSALRRCSSVSEGSCSSSRETAPSSFQAGDQGGIAVHHRAVRLGLRFAHQQVGLQGVVAQDQVFDGAGHLVQDAVTVRFRQLAGVDFGVQPDLDVDFVVGAVHAGRVVDRIGEDAAAGQRELDTAGLGRAQVAAFGYDLAAQFVAVDADVVVGAVLHLGVGLGRGLDVGADAAVVEQVDRRQQDAVHQLFRRSEVSSMSSAARTCGDSSM